MSDFLIGYLTFYSIGCGFMILRVYKAYSSIKKDEGAFVALYRIHIIKTVLFVLFGWFSFYYILNEQEFFLRYEVNNISLEYIKMSAYEFKSLKEGELEVGDNKILFNDPFFVVKAPVGEEDNKYIYSTVDSYDTFEDAFAVAKKLK